MTDTTAITTRTATSTVAATGPARAVGLRQHAPQAARAYRATDSDGFDRRHDDPAEWNRWARRACVARDIAAALDVPPGRVTVTDDPARSYRTRTGPVLGDLITVTDPATGHPWRFMPDITAPGQSWLLIDNCPDCDGPVPVTRSPRWPTWATTSTPTARSGPPTNATTTLPTGPAARSSSARPPTDRHPPATRTGVPAMTATTDSTSYYGARNAYLDQFEISERYEELCDRTKDPIVRLVVTFVDAIARADEDIVRLGRQITHLIEQANTRIANRHSVNNLGELQRTPVEYDQACATRQAAAENLRQVAAAYRQAHTP